MRRADCDYGPIWKCTGTRCNGPSGCRTWKPEPRACPRKRHELQYRGFSRIEAADDTSPELPTAYAPVERQGQKWRDLTGFHTRYGDVSELLRDIDDRYVIMNAGDEMRLTFPALAPPEDGWTRDFVLIGDGWVKDGNVNTTFSKTVLPLPAHDLPDYDTPPGNLEDDPVYCRHSEDWQTYHTRYVTPSLFERGIRPLRQTRRMLPQECDKTKSFEKIGASV